MQKPPDEGTIVSQSHSHVASVLADREHFGSGSPARSGVGICKAGMSSRSMRSRQWSCSELEQANRDLLRVKKEKPNGDDAEDQLEKAPLYILRK